MKKNYVRQPALKLYELFACWDDWTEGQAYLSIANTKTTTEVSKSRPHLKMICGHLLTYGEQFEQSGYPH